VPASSSTGTPELIANGGTFSGAINAPAWSTFGALLGEFNGGSSNIYFNNFTTAAPPSGAVGGGTAGEQASMTVGRHFGGTDYWDGGLAELIAYNRILSPGDKARLRNYLNARYALSIG
jgi:hypothetical protein